MNRRTKLKYTITKAVIDQLPNSNYTFENAMKEVWYSVSGDSMRLTPKGNDIFRTASIEFFELPFKLKDSSLFEFIKDCSKKIQCPYFINTKVDFIRLYDSKIAMMLALYGDIESYLESVRVR